jgi:octaprenyl-diphosphate synthase|tara:strand:- start:1414 stop:2376 length:963 start_codon:yes stop_codon:yes gene_type:complete
MQQVRNTVATEFNDVDRLIIEQLQSNVPLVENIGHYIVDAGGKRMRPMLALLSGGANENLNQHHITLAAVIEFIHTATLLHDDVVDISALRRGRPTVNEAWGNAPSVLVGDFLYSRAFQLLVSIGNMPVMGLMANVTNTIAEGEVLQLTKAGDPDTTEDQYFQVITNKTAVLFAAAAAGGAILAKQDQTTVDNYYQYGLNLGIAFQLIDDVLDYDGNAADMGKNVGDDLAEGKPTLPLIYAMRKGTDQQAKLIRRAIENKTNEDIDAVIAIVKHSGALTYTKDKAKAFSDNAKFCLSGAKDTPYTQGLARLATLAVDRNA